MTRLQDVAGSNVLHCNWYNSGKKYMLINIKIVSLSLVFL